MTEVKFPFCPLKVGKMVRIARRFRGIGSKFCALSPGLGEQIKQTGLEIEKEDYGAVMALMFFAYFIFATFITFAFAQKFAPENAVTLAFIIGFLFAALILVQLLFYPSVLLKKKIRNLERNLVFALRTILVEIKAGVTLFDAINIVAEGDNGQVSREFRKSVERIQTGQFHNKTP